MGGTEQVPSIFFDYKYKISYPKTCMVLKKKYNFVRRIADKVIWRI